MEGNNKNTIKMKIGNPIYDIEDRYMGIADKNVTKIYLIDDDKLAWEKTLDVTVEKIKVNKNGFSFLCWGNVYGSYCKKYK